MNNKENKDDLILSQWKTCVEMANSVSHRRDTMNNIFITLNLAIIGVVTAFWGKKAILVLIAGILVSVLWVFFIRNYRRLNCAKFDVINQMEQFLPYQPFVDEWEILKNDRKYVDGTKLEKVLPVMFIVIYLVTIIILLVVKNGGEK